MSSSNVDTWFVVLGVANGSPSAQSVGNSYHESCAFSDHDPQKNRVYYRVSEVVGINKDDRENNYTCTVPF